MNNCCHGAPPTLAPLQRPRRLLPCPGSWGPGRLLSWVKITWIQMLEEQYDWYKIIWLVYDSNAGRIYVYWQSPYIYIYIHDYMITYVCMVGRLRSFGDGIFSGANIQLQVSTLQGTITYPPVRHFWVVISFSGLVGYVSFLQGIIWNIHICSTSCISPRREKNNQQTSWSDDVGGEKAIWSEIYT